MSWSRRMTGTASSVIDAAERWVEELANAEHLEPNPAVRAGQRAQAERVLEAVKAFADRSLPGYVITVSTGGHASGDDPHSARSYYVNLGTYLSVPAAAAAAR